MLFFSSILLRRSLFIAFFTHLRIQKSGTAACRDGTWNVWLSVQGFQVNGRHTLRIFGTPETISNLPIALPDEWTTFVDTPLIDSELEKLRKSINRQAPYGAEQWQIQISEELGLDSTMNLRGRPKKTLPEK